MTSPLAAYDSAQAVLGAALCSMEAAELVAGLPAAAFPDDGQRATHRAIAMLVGEGIRPELTQLRRVLNGDGPPAAVLNGYLEATPVDAGGGNAVALDSVRHHVRLLREAATWQEIEGAAQIRDVETLSARVEALRAGGKPAAEPELRRLLDVLEDPTLLEPPEPIVSRLAWAGRLTLLAAEEKSGKSTLCAAAAASVSGGASFLGDPTTAGPVLWVGLEEALGDTARRFVDMQATPGSVYLLERLASPVADFAAAVEKVQPRLVVLDSLGAFAHSLEEPPDSGDAGAWTAVMMALLRPIRNTAAGLVVIHHTRRSDGKYRDSSAIGATADMILTLSEGSDVGVRKLKARGRWSLPDFSVRLNGARFEVLGGELSLDARVQLFVEANPGCSMRAVRGGVEGKGTDVDAAVNRLIGARAIEDRGAASSGRKLHATEMRG